MSDADSPPAPYNDGEAQQMAAVLRTAIASRSTTFDAMSGHVVSKGMQAVESRMTMLTASVAFLAIFGLAGAIYTVRDSGVAARAPAAGADLAMLPDRHHRLTLPFVPLLPCTMSTPGRCKRLVPPAPRRPHAVREGVLRWPHWRRSVPTCRCRPSQHHQGAGDGDDSRCW